MKHTKVRNGKKKIKRKNITRKKEKTYKLRSNPNSKRNKITKRIKQEPNNIFNKTIKKIQNGGATARRNIKNRVDILLNKRDKQILNKPINKKKILLNMTNARATPLMSYTEASLASSYVSYAVLETFLVPSM